MREVSPVAALERGVAVLRLFHAGEPVLTAAAISSNLNIPRGSLHRLLGGLLSLGLVERRGDGFGLAPGVLTLGYEYLATQDLVSVSDLSLRALRDTLGCSTHLAVRDGRKIIYLIKNASLSGLSSNVGVGSVLPAASTLMGRLLLAALPIADLTALYPDVVERDVLAPLLEDDRAQGFNASDGFFEPGVAASAALIHDRHGQAVAAINAVRASSQAGQPQLDTMTRHVRKTAQAISARLGAPQARRTAESVPA